MASRRTRPAQLRRSRRAPVVPAGVALGAHVSIAAGLAAAVETAWRIGATALQIFTKGNNQWAARPLGDDEVRAFHEARARLGIAHAIAHDSYLINLASPVDDLFERSLAAFRIELERCERLGLSHLVFHPGAHVGAGEEAGLARVARALDRLHGDLPGYRVKATLETTAGQGSCLGHRFEHLRQILERVREPERVAVCVDTCHLLAAGYDLRTEAGYQETFDRLDQVIGLDKVQAFHVNDSKKPLGSRVDRHEHVALGEIGETAFRCLMNDRRFRGVPMVIETPKGKDLVRADTENLSRLVGFVAPPSPPLR